MAAHEYMKKKFSQNQLLAYQLCDAFFADVLSREGSDRLYKVTSTLGEYFLEDSHVDGIIYTSVKAKGEPVIALSPTAVNAKVDYVKAEAITINRVYDSFGYKTSHQASIINNSLNWK